MLFNARRNEYVESEGPVRYLDGSGLARPLDAPRPQMIIMGLFVLVGIGIGAYLLHSAFDSLQGGAARSQATVEENLARGVTYDLPALASLAGLSDDEIKQSFADAGYTTIDRTNEADYPNGGFEVVKLPSDVTTAEAGLLYAKGIESLDAADAALLLNGSWTFSIDRTEGIDARVRYADFTSGSVEAAIASALASEGLDPATTPADGTGTGVDDAGNTFQTGTVLVGETTFTWRVSAIALSSVYEISGLPESAVYVGVRLTA